MKLRYFFFFLIIGCNTIETPINLKYVVDPELSAQVSETPLPNEMGYNGEMRFKLYENDSLILDSYEKNKHVGFFLTNHLNADTLYVTGYIGVFVGFGFSLDVFDEYYNVRFMLKSDMPLYKHKESDSTLLAGLSIPCSSSGLTLGSKPSYQEGDRTSGRLTLVSEDYWQQSDGRLKRCRVEIEALFLTKEL